MGLPGLPVYEEIDLPDDNDDKPSSFTEEKKKPGRVKKSYKKIKRGLQGNKVTSQFFPPKGDVAENITLIIATIILFLMARAVLGTLAAPGGTIFAIFILILFSLIAGQIVIQCAALITKLVGVDIKIPQLLGMMAVGIALKNVPYNQSQFNSPECMNISKSIHDHSDIDVNSTEFVNELGGFRIDPKDVHINHQHSDIAKSLKNIDNINLHGENSVDTENHPNSGPSHHTGVESISNNEDHADQNKTDASKQEPDNEEKHGLNHVEEKEVSHDISHDSNVKTVQQEKHNHGDDQTKDEHGHHITTEEKEEVKHMQVSIMKDHNHTVQQEENIHHEKEVMNIPVHRTPDNHHMIQQEEDSNNSEHSHDEHNHSIVHDKKEEIKNTPVHSTPDQHHMIQQEEHSNNSEHSHDEHYHHEMHEKKEDIKNTPVHITPDRNYTIQQEEDTSRNEYSHDAQDVIHKKIEEVKHTPVHTTPDHNNKYEQLVNNDNPINETNIHSLAKEEKDEVTHVEPHSLQDHNDKKVEHGRSDEQTKHKDIHNQNQGEVKNPRQHLHTDGEAQNQNNETVHNENKMILNHMEDEKSQDSRMTPHSIYDHNEKKITHQQIDNLNNKPITEVLNRPLNKNELNNDVKDSNDINGQGISQQEKKEASQTPQYESKNQKDENGHEMHLHDVKSDNINQDNKEQALANNNTKMKTTPDDAVLNGTDISEIAQGVTKHDVEAAVTKIYQQNVLYNSYEKDESTTENSAEDLVDTKIQNRSRRSSGHDEPQIYVDPCKKRFIGNDLDPLLTRTLRSICLTVILLMAGLELDPPALWRLKWIVLRTTFIPCIIEAFAASLFCYLILGFPFSVGLCFGFVLCGVSPAVIIPGLVNLSQRGYGVKKGIPTLVIATCSADDLVAIGGFGIALSITYNPDAPILSLAFHGPSEVIMGIAFGIFWGYICQWFPSKQNPNHVLFRFIILFSGGLFALFGAHLIHYDGAGGLACVIMAFVASIQWRKEGWGDHNPITDIFGKMWIILAPIIFSLIGTNIVVEKMDGESVALGIAVIVLSMIVRMVFTYFAAVCGGMTAKEKIFLSISWLPKATVQAALGKLSYQWDILL